MIKHIKIVAALLVASFSFTQAQTIEELQADKNITWVGEVEYIYTLDTSIYTGSRKNMSDAEYQVHNDFKPLKLQMDELFSPNYNLGLVYYKVMNAMEEGEVKVYPTSDLEKPYTSDELQDRLSTIDTIITFDPENFQEVVEVVVNSADPHDYRHFVVKHLVYYNKKEMMLYALPQAIGMRGSFYNDNGNLIGYKQDVWMSMDVLGKALDYPNMPSISWAKRTYHDGYEEPEFEVLKGDMDWYELMTMVAMDNEKKVNKVTLTHPYNRDGVGERLDKKNIQYYTVSPKGDRSISGMRFIHDWYWDSEKKQFSVYYVGFAPLRYADHDVPYLKPTFYRRADKK